MDSLLTKIERIQVSREADQKIKDAFTEVANILNNILINMEFNNDATKDLAGVPSQMTDEAVESTKDMREPAPLLLTAG